MWILWVLQPFYLDFTLAGLMLSRMNYGEAQRMKAMVYKLTAQSLSELPKTEKNNEPQALAVDAQRPACINDATWEIMLHPRDSEKGASMKAQSGQ